MTDLEFLIATKDYIEEVIPYEYVGIEKMPSIAKLISDPGYEWEARLVYVEVIRRIEAIQLTTPPNHD